MAICRVKHCRKQQASRQLLCVEHWYLVPEELKRALWDEYRPGQTGTRASAVFLRLAARAVRVATTRDRNNALDRDKHTGERRR